MDGRPNGPWFVFNGKRYGRDSTRLFVTRTHCHDSTVSEASTGPGKAHIIESLSEPSQIVLFHTR